MKGRHFLLAALLPLTFASRVIFAEPALEMPIILPAPTCCELRPPPQESACCIAPRSTMYRYLGGLYVTGQYAYSDNHIGDIVQIGPPGIAAITKGSVNEHTHSPNFAIGYQLWHFPFISPRVEVAYMPRINLDYDANPFLQGIDSSINSSIDSHTLLFKLYNDFEFCNFPLVPYIEGGIGKAWTTVDADSTVNLFPGLIPPFVGSSSDRRTNRAWDLGFGAKYRFYRDLFLNVGWEYVSLGDDLKWNIVYSNPAIIFNPPVTVNLRSGNFISRTFFAGLTWQPFANYPPVNY